MWSRTGGAAAKTRGDEAGTRNAGSTFATTLWPLPRRQCTVGSPQGSQAALQKADVHDTYITRRGDETERLAAATRQRREGHTKGPTTK
jgi:hypothetical protein